MQNYQRWSEWKKSDYAKYIFDWEQKQFDLTFPEFYGVNAIQIGTPELSSLRSSVKMNKFLVLDPQYIKNINLHLKRDISQYIFICANYGHLPFINDSIHLLVLPHILEISRNPHQLLREMARVISPGGYLVLTGFNSYSLWNLGQNFFCFASRVGNIPNRSSISFYRLKDWLNLLEFQLYIGKFGCYKSPFCKKRLYHKSTLMELAGERWWPIFGAIFFIVAIKSQNASNLVALSETDFVPAFAI